MKPLTLDNLVNNNQNMLRVTHIKFLFVCLWLTFFASTTALQAKKDIDSLLVARSQNYHDSVHVRTDIYLAMQFETIAFDSALFYYRRALALAQQQNMKLYPSFEALVLENIGFAYIYGRGEVVKGIDFLKQSLAIHQHSENAQEALKTAYNIGAFFANLEEYDSAVWYYQYVVEKNTALGTHIRHHESYNNMGMVNYYRGNLKQATDALLKGIRLKEELGETKEIQDSYMNIGLVFMELGQFEKAKQYYRKSGAIFRNMGTGVNAGYALSLQNIADCLIAQDSVEDASALYKESFNVYQEIAPEKKRANYHRCMAVVAKHQRDYQEAHEQLLLAEKAFTDRVSRDFRGGVFSQIAEVKLLLADTIYKDNPIQRRLLLEGAVTYGEKGWKDAQAVNDKRKQLILASVLMDAYSGLKKHEQALAYAQIFNKLNTEMNNQAKTQAIAQMATEYETERVENENIALRQERKINEANLQRQQILSMAVGVVTVLIALIAFVIYRSREKMRMANQTIAQSLSEKELLLKEIHHRVKNNLQVVSSLLDLQARGIDDEKALATFTEGQNRVKAMSLIHQKLYQNENLTTIDFEDYANQLITQLATVYNQEAVQYYVEVKEQVYLDIDTAIPLGLILNELVSNAYKHAFEETNQPKIHIAIDAVEVGKYELTVSDNGIGLPEMFDFTKAKSLGLRLVRRLTKQLYGQVEYSYHEGAHFVIGFSDTVHRRAH